MEFLSLLYDAVLIIRSEPKNTPTAAIVFGISSANGKFQITANTEYKVLNDGSPMSATYFNTLYILLFNFIL